MKSPFFIGVLWVLAGLGLIVANSIAEAGSTGALLIGALFVAVGAAIIRGSRRG